MPQTSRPSRTPRTISSFRYRGLAFLAIALLAAAGSGCSALDALGGEPAELRVYASASLTEAFHAMAADFEASHPRTRLSFEFGAADDLSRRLEAGEPVDVLALDDAERMTDLADRGLIEGGFEFAQNRLALLHQPDLSPPIVDPAGLARPGLRLALAREALPAGRLARAALGQLDVWPQAEPNLVGPAGDVKAVVDLLMQGQADVGIVYITDVTPLVAGTLSGMAMPPAVTQRAVYQAARVAGSEHRRDAQAFVDFLAGPEAGRVLTARGFELP